MIHVLQLSAPFLLNPIGKCLKCSHVSSIMFLSKLMQHGPCKIWVDPFCQITHQFIWWTNHLITFWTQKESKWFSCCFVVHHCPMQTTFVSPICKCLNKTKTKTKCSIKISHHTLKGPDLLPSNWTFLVRERQTHTSSRSRHTCPILKVCVCLYSIRSVWQDLLSARKERCRLTYHESVTNIDNKGIEIWTNGMPFIVNKNLKSTNLVLM